MGLDGQTTHTHTHIITGSVTIRWRLPNYACSLIPKHPNVHKKNTPDWSGDVIGCGCVSLPSQWALSWICHVTNYVGGWAEIHNINCASNSIWLHHQISHIITATEYEIPIQYRRIGYNAPRQTTGYLFRDFIKFWNVTTLHLVAI